MAEFTERGEERFVKTETHYVMDDVLGIGVSSGSRSPMRDQFAARRPAFQYDGFTRGAGCSA
ncbi:Uncharacterised protein [Actinobacillus pleuropneumoniae]|nr:Uncharacterised protein [Actinobacillus pleuropneumoniae]